MREMQDVGIDWLGEIPQEWDLTSAKRCMTITHGIDPKTEGDIPVYGSGSASFKTCGEFKEGPAVLVGRKGTINIPCYVSARYWNTDTAFDVHELSGKMNIRYYYYLAHTFNYEYYMSKTTLPSMTLTNYQNMMLPLPPLMEQQHITLFLDAQTARIDEALSLNRIQINELRLYKQSLIAETVTRGLDPDAPMKDSGVDWIGQIPESWTISRIKDKFFLRNERNFEPLENVNLISLYTDKGVIQHSDLTETTGNRAVTAEGYKKVYRNDIVVNIILCWMGAVGMSDYDGVTSPAYDVYQPKAGTFSKYYHYLFRTTRFNGECFRYGRGIMLMRWRTYSDEFTAIKIPVPPPDVQREIVRFLDEKCGKIDALISLKQAKTEKLTRYRQSLIYEYVTGKKEAP